MNEVKEQVLQALQNQITILSQHRNNQTTEEQINFKMEIVQLCSECGEPTGRYAENERNVEIIMEGNTEIIGPLCEWCFIHFPETK